MSCQNTRYLSKPELDGLYAAVQDIAMTVKQLRRQSEENSRILAELWDDLDSVKRATVPPKKIAPSIQKEAGRA